MPLAGATSPVTLREMVVQHCAESLSGVLIHQLARAGRADRLGRLAVGVRHAPRHDADGRHRDHDDRRRLTPRSGKHLGLPTHAYMGMSDAKIVDWQTGMESGIGAVLAALAGVNMVSGPGMLDFESCQSLEKLVLDNEVCGMALRLVRGIAHDSAGEAVELLRQLVASAACSATAHPRNFRAELLPARAR